MWVILAYFVVLRSRIVATSGPADPENTWGFGQVLALATWVPIVAEFVYIFIWGLEESLDSHLPSGFTAQRQRTTSSGLGFLSRTTFAEPDPYEMVEDPEPGLDTKTHTWTTASSSEAPHPDTPFGPGHRGGSLTDANQDGQVSRVQISPTHAPNPEETRAYHQTPWQQWESTGW
ncbi:hypothetical protein VTK73DRAFT_2387 [Phialemonium thermophilum]|uniref:Uncharacterized protein n=1 Tax=Phialemonium thermophilum TaxID=223376 RepID=A0ABR3VS72_9PEZI